MKRNVQERLAKKRELFISRTTAVYPDIDLGLFSGKPSLAVRANTIKGAGAYGDPISWAPNCYISSLSRDELTNLPEFEHGSVYLQNSSSFIPPLVLDAESGHKVLDMCAAPGGKASHVAAIADNNIELWVNDNSKPRLLRMRSNLNRLGVKVHSETMFGIERIGRELPNEYFDRILLDAPCSGEGALRLNDDASLTYWSMAQIKRLQKLQKQAVSAAWKLLKPGGILVYSTCTMAPEENEMIIDWLLRKNDDPSVEAIDITVPERVPAVSFWQDRSLSSEVSSCVRIRPTETMEAFFVAKIRKQRDV